MVCCIVATLVLAVVHRLLPWRRTSTDAGFAPAVRRPATGMKVVGAPFDRTHRELPVLPRRRAIAAWTLRLGAIAAGLYLATSAVLVVLGVAHDVADSSSWLIRSVGVLLIAASAAGLGRVLSARGVDPLTRTQTAGCGSLAAGVVFLELMVVDMHVLGLYHLPDSFAHHMFQASCLLAAGIGVVLLGDRPHPVPRPTATLIRGRS